MEPTLIAEGLTVLFRTKHGFVRALNKADFNLYRGRILVVIGESGSGKTVLAHALMRLLPKNAEVSGRVLLGGTSLLDLPLKEMERVRGRRMALIPQGAATALNPVRKIGPLLLEMAAARGVAPGIAQKQLRQFLGALNLDYDEIANAFPHQLSGGMQQRVLNAVSMLGDPEVVIADEPTYGLDAALVDTTATQLLAVAKRGSSLLVITHDLRLARRLGGRIAIVYGSYIVELRDTADFFASPKHPYSQALLQALPENGGVPIAGLPPELSNLPEGCPFTPRCKESSALCSQAVPPLVPLSETDSCRCVLYA